MNNSQKIIKEIKKLVAAKIKAEQERAGATIPNELINQIWQELNDLQLPYKLTNDPALQQILQIYWGNV